MQEADVISGLEDDEEELSHASERDSHTVQHASPSNADKGPLFQPVLLRLFGSKPDDRRTRIRYVDVIIFYLCI